MNSILYPLGDKIGYIELIDKLGTDDDICRAARISTDREDKSDLEKNKKLLNYLWEHQHRSPFRMVSVKFRVKAPLFVAREWYRHNFAQYEEAQDCWNEQSARYTVMKDEFYILPAREQSRENKQGSINKEPSHYDKIMWIEQQERIIKDALSVRNYTIDHGIARELANRILPQTIYTSFIWLINMDALFNFLTLRLSDDAQFEIKKYAEAIVSIVRHPFPVALSIFDKYELKVVNKI